MVLNKEVTLTTFQTLYMSLFFTTPVFRHMVSFPVMRYEDFDWLDKYTHLNHICLPWHGLLLHGRVSLLGPEHRARSLDGEGLVQVRLRSCSPSPQTALHSPQSSQSLHLPLTTVSERDKIYSKAYL